MKRFALTILFLIPFFGLTIPSETMEVPTLWEIFTRSFEGYLSYIWSEITFQTDPWYINYFWWLVLLSLIVWGLEILFPWRKYQGIFRKDFWLDGFYMFFNFYIFAAVISGFYELINVVLKRFGFEQDALTIIDLSNLAPVLQLLIFFVFMDFVQWFTHVMLHRVPLFWRFHKVHHSVREMGFAAHLRYHWMENILYKPLKVLIVMFLGGFEPEQAFLVHFFAIAIGHLNHANLGWDYGPFKYILNNPKMHIWHHARELPPISKYGSNYGISLSLWDYLFRTNYVPKDGRDIELGFEGVETYPKSFWKQLVSGFTKKD